MYETNGEYVRQQKVTGRATGSRKNNMRIPACLIEQLSCVGN